MITPIQGRILVKTKSTYENLETTDEQFGNSKTRGEVIAIADDFKEEAEGFGIAVGKIVYFGKYEDTAPYNVDGEDGYILIKLEEIGGVSD